MHSDPQSQGKENVRMKELSISDIDAAWMLIKMLFEKGDINEQTANAAIEKIKEMRSKKNAA